MEDNTAKERFFCSIWFFKEEDRRLCLKDERIVKALLNDKGDLADSFYKGAYFQRLRGHLG